MFHSLCATSILRKQRYHGTYVCSVAQPCLILCDSMNCYPSGSSAHGIFPARILEHAAISSSRGSSQLRDQICVSCIAGRSFPLQGSPRGLPGALHFRLDRHPMPPAPRRGGREAQATYTSSPSTIRPGRYGREALLSHPLIVGT